MDEQQNASPLQERVQLPLTQPQDLPANTKDNGGSLLLWHLVLDHKWRITKKCPTQCKKTSLKSTTWVLQRYKDPTHT